MQSALFRQVLLIVVFLCLTPVALGASIVALAYIEPDDSKKPPEVSETSTGVQIYAALPNKRPSISASIGTKDSRVEIIRQYLAKYNSPLLGHEKYIVDAADKHEIDFRLTTAIAQQESNLCKRIPPQTYNCWGWGIHSRGTLGFSSFQEGIYTVSEGLKKNYIDKGYNTPEVIMTKYTPLSKGSWARGVRQFMEEMQ